MTDLAQRLARALSDSYRIERELGGGGMSRVFVARDHGLSRTVVVKVLPDDMAGAVSLLRFRREIALAASLHHPHIVPVLTAGEVDGVPFYTMPFVEGESLRHRLAAGPMPVAFAIRILREVASALQYAHERGVVHRDIKPENVLLTGGVATVTDFGVAKALGAATADTQTQTMLTAAGLALGTPMYMAPEQISADPSADGRADLYSFGCLAYELLTGEPPFKGTVQQLFAAHIATEASPVERRRPDVPAPLAALIGRCLRKSPDDRPASAAEVVAALDGIATSGIHPARASSRRTLYIVAAAAVIVMAAIAGATALRGAGGRASLHSVGVLPFANLSSDPGNASFSEGVTQEITTALGRVEGLRVASQTSATNIKADARTLSRALGVDALLEGSIQRVGNRVRITARLITPDGFQLWSDSYDRDLRDVFAVQDDIAHAIVAGLRLTLEGGAARSLVRTETSDPEAHRLYLEGMYYWNQRSVASFRKAMSSFRAAIARDSAYAAPWAGLSLAYAVIVTYDAVDVAAISDTALQAGRRALELDSTSADGMLGVAQAEFQTGRRAEGLRDFERAVALDSNNARVRHWYAEALASAGQMNEAVAQIRRALALEPLTLTINTNVGRVELEARHFREAEAALDRTFELDSNFAAARQLRGSLYEHLGRYDDAIRERRAYLRLTTAKRPVGALALLARSYALAGRRREADSLFAEVQRLGQTGQRAYGPLAVLYYTLGKKAEAIAALDTGVARNDANLVMSSREEMYDPLRKEPKARALFNRLESLESARRVP